MLVYNQDIMLCCLSYQWFVYVSNLWQWWLCNS